MRKLFIKNFAFAIAFGLLLAAFTAFALLDTFVIPHSVSAAASAAAQSESPAKADETPVTSVSIGKADITDSSYNDGNISVTLSTLRKSDTDVYVAEVTLSSPEYLKTALAQSTYGTNVTETTSSMAESAGAVLAVNGDYYGANSKGYVIKNGVLYRSTVRENSENGDLAIYSDGSFAVIYENEISAEQLIADGVQQLFAFGPALIENGETVVSDDDEVSRSMTSNPRTAIGMIDPLHYVFIVSDGRTSASEGLSLSELADVMQSYNCICAYNLDGGGSSTMYFNGQIINNPTTNGKRTSEREVSDIVYIGN